MEGVLVMIEKSSILTVNCLAALVASAFKAAVPGRDPLQP